MVPGLHPPDTPPAADMATDSRDEAWLARLRAGDAAAFEEIFHAYSARLYRFVYGYVKSTAVAEELVQDVLLRLWEQREGRGTGPQTLRAYLYTAARSRALDHLRHEGVVHRSEDEAVGTGIVLAMGQPAHQADDRLRDEELRAALDRALAELPERRRTAMTLYWQDGLRYAEIAEVMGVSVKTVENHLATALKTLRERLARFY